MVLRQRQGAARRRRTEVPRRARRVRVVEAGPFQRHRRAGSRERAQRRQDARALRLRAPVLLADGQQTRGRLRLRDRGRPGRRGPADRQPQAHAARRPPVADRRRMALPRRWRRVQGPQALHRGAGGPVRQGDRRRGLRPQGPGAGLRRPAGDVRGLRPQQVHLDGRHPVDAQQRVALDDLAPLRLLRPAAATTDEEGVRALHAQFSYDDRSVVVVNDRPFTLKGVKVGRGLRPEPRLKFSKSAVVDSGPTASSALHHPAAARPDDDVLRPAEGGGREGRGGRSNFYWPRPARTSSTGTRPSGTTPPPARTPT